MTTRGAALLLVAVATTASMLVSAPPVTDDPLPPQPLPAAAPVAPPPTPPAADEIAARIESAIVLIDARHGWTGVAGTGVVLTSDGSVVTNHHVVSGATDIDAVSPATGLIYDVDVLGYDRTRDIAVLRLGAAHDLPVVAVADIPPGIGAPVTAFGNADGGGIVVAAPGTVVAHDRSVLVRDSADGSRHRLTGMLQTDAAIRPGDSGGPLVDAYGAVVGINTAGAVDSDDATGETVSDTPYEAYAVPIADALEVVDQVRRGVSTDTVHVGPTPRLGIDVTTARADGQNRGAEILWVSYGTPAYGIGLESGDVVIAFDDTPVTSTADLDKLLSRRSPGDRIRIDWQDRSGALHTAEVVLDAGPVR